MPKLPETTRAERIAAATCWVNMTDKAMSGWGKAPGKSIYCIACDTRAEADAIEKAAHERSEMRYITVASAPRRARRHGDHVSIRHVSELGGSWVRYLPRD